MSAPSAGLVARSKCTESSNAMAKYTNNTTAADIPIAPRRTTRHGARSGS